MAAYSLRYSFRQRFRVRAGQAYAWCTDFAPGDHALEGARGRRAVTWISPETVVLTDRFPRPLGGGSVRKVKLVRLDPRTLRWTSTHLAGPARWSQFWYHIVPAGVAGSSLEFIGFELRRARVRPSPARIAGEARRLRTEDSNAWKLLARAMERDLVRPR